LTFVTDVVAAVDCGSNSTRILIADSDGNALYRDMNITRLSQGVDASGTLNVEAMARSISVLEQYREACDRLMVRYGLAVATSAVRDASNGADFLNQVRATMGFEAAILTGNQEAALSYDGATFDLEASHAPTMILDIGGGSTELAMRKNGTLLSFSMQLGCVRVTERALGRGVVDADHESAARSMITDELDRAFDAVPDLRDVVGNVRLVGLAGTVATLAQLDAGLRDYDRDVVHHRVMTRATVQAWRDRLGAETPKERLRHPGMIVGREDVLVAGLYVLDAVLERFAINELLSSENDILDGIVRSQLARLRNKS
jgi:exopolyphosphatase / guanosine-5'-triphosphate,3'-diphosphate pyrophosphatase